MTTLWWKSEKNFNDINIQQQEIGCTNNLVRWHRKDLQYNVKWKIWVYTMLFILAYILAICLEDMCLEKKHRFI